MGISKVRLNGDTLMDVTTDTVASNNLLSGKTATGADGEKVNGSIAAKTSSDLTASGATVTAPAGYYASNASKSVASGTAGTPTATKSTVSNHAVTVTPSVTNTAGYISGGTKTGTGVSVAVAELESGTKTITENGTGISVSGYSSVDVDVAGSGGVAVEPKDVNFMDYDGTLLYSYTKAEFALLDALPANPTHDGLTSQGWNWSKQNIANQLTAMPNDPVLVGQQYITNDGQTRFYVHLGAGCLAPTLGLAVNGTATVNWGDGSSNSTITGTSLSTLKTVQHNYAIGGDYVIRVSVSGSMAIIGGSSYGSQLLCRNNTTGSTNRVYQNAIQKVEIGSNTSIGTYAFNSCFSLSSITIPSGVTSIGTYAFTSCYSLFSITIPSGVTSIGERVFSTCYSLSSITIPSGVTSIGTYAFNSCFSLFSITIPSGVTSIGERVFSACYSLFSITFPNGVTSISAYALQNCHSLSNVTIPSGVTSIGNYAFQANYGLGEIHFKPTTPAEIAASTTFSNIQTDCIIYVPTGHLSDYTTGPDAVNYPSPSTYTYVEE